MKSLSLDYINAPCELKTLANEPLLTGYVRKIVDGYIEIINTYDKMPLLPCNTFVKLSAYSSKDQFIVVIGSVYLSTEEFIRIADTKSVASFEKRNFFRVALRKETRAYVPDEDTEKFVPDWAWFPVTLRDLSLSGALINCERRLMDGEKFVLEMDIHGMPIQLPCVVLRRVTRESDDRVDYGCSFTENRGRQFDRLSQYIFELQREEIQRLRQKVES